MIYNTCLSTTLILSHIATNVVTVPDDEGANFAEPETNGDAFMHKSTIICDKFVIEVRTRS